MHVYVCSNSVWLTKCVGCGFTVSLMRILSFQSVCFMLLIVEMIWQRSACLLYCCTFAVFTFMFHVDDHIYGCVSLHTCLFLCMFLKQLRLFASHLFVGHACLLCVAYANTCPPGNKSMPLPGAFSKALAGAGLENTADTG